MQETTRRITAEFVFQVVSILSQRLLGHAVSLNVLHISQIGFLPSQRTSDDVLTLRTLLDKCVHGHRVKIHACFVNFITPFDSVWHGELLHKLPQIGVSPLVRESELRNPGKSGILGFGIPNTAQRIRNPESGI